VVSTELGDFLKARRREVSPESAGLPSGGARRVPGLRREEVARLASITPAYYMRLEQGRRRAAEPVLEALARALRLTADERTYLYELSGKDPSRGGPAVTQQVQPPLRHLLDELTTTPAFVLGRRTDILAWNRPAAALFVDFAELPPAGRNFVRLVFLHPRIREMYVDWPYAAKACVAQLRMEAAQDPDDPLLAALVADLSAQDPDFRRWWADHHVAGRTAGTKTLRHPTAGLLDLAWSTLTDAADPTQNLITLTAAPGTPAHAALRRL
jgi:transcriptional regulator with XRE-family HTH domain